MTGDDLSGTCSMMLWHFMSISDILTLIVISKLSFILEYKLSFTSRTEYE